MKLLDWLEEKGIEPEHLFVIGYSLQAIGLMMIFFALALALVAISL